RRKQTGAHTRWARSDATVPVPSSAASGPSGQTGLRPETSTAPDDRRPPRVSRGTPALRAVFFPVLLNLRVGFGMARVGGHLAPAVPGQKAIHDRSGHRAAQPLG